MTAEQGSKRIDISAPLRELCRLLYVEYEDVAKIIFRPGDTEVTIYNRNEHGNIALNEDKSGPVKETLAFKTRS